MTTPTYRVPWMCRMDRRGRWVRRGLYSRNRLVNRLARWAAPIGGPR